MMINKRSDVTRGTYYQGRTQMGRSLDLRSDQIDDSERSKLRRRPLSAHCC